MEIYRRSGHLSDAWVMVHRKQALMVEKLKAVAMSNEFCPDCGHLLSKSPIPCVFCGWSEDAEHFLCKGLDPAQENVVVFNLVDDVIPGRELGL